MVEGNQPVSDNDWEQVKKGGDAAIKRWIESQLEHRSCTVVLVGAGTAHRKWIDYEIVKSWNKGMGVVGIYIHGLKNQYGYVSRQGRNPFDYIKCGEKKLSEIIHCCNSRGSTSVERYAWISKHLSNAVGEAIRIRKAHG